MTSRGRERREPRRVVADGVGPVRPGAIMDPSSRNTSASRTATRSPSTRRRGGYQALKKALGMTPDAVVEAVKASGLRGRGGAGFPCGMKWQFVDKKSPKPKYICCNADESEPGTFKDHVLMERNPHLRVRGLPDRLPRDRREGGLHLHPRRVPPRADWCSRPNSRRPARPATSARTSSAPGSTARSTSIAAPAPTKPARRRRSSNRSRASARSRASSRRFPAVEGLWNCPTAVNNVETLCNVPFIIERGAEWFAGLGPEKNGGPKLYCISGHVQKPGVYEASMDGHAPRPDLRPEVRRRHPRRPRSSRPSFPAARRCPCCCRTSSTVPASFDGIAKAGSMLGSAGMIVMDETTCMVWAAENLLYFYKHESCGKCTPCREGSALAAPAARQGRARRGPDARSRPAAVGGQQHHGQDALRVRRRRGHAGAFR